MLAAAATRQVSGQLARPFSLTALAAHPRAGRVVSHKMTSPALGALRFLADTMEIKVPSMGDSISEGTIARWEKNVGDYVAENETFCVISTDKVNVDVGATGFSGVLTAQLAAEGATVKVGAPLATIDKSAAKAAEAPAKPVEAAASTSTPGKPAEAVKETKKEVQDQPKKESTPKPAAPQAQAAKPKAPVVMGDRSTSREEMTRIRRRIAERLVDAQATGALLTTFNEVDMTNLIEARNKYKDLFEKSHGIKLGFMSAFVRASVAAIQEVPIVNSSIEGTEIVHHHYIDISVAVSAPRGLMVPVVRNAERMSFADVEKAIAELGQKAKEDKLTLEEMSGGTFTITNGGVFGSLMSTPMINSPQSAILGMHAIKQRAVVLDNGTIAARPMMYLALTYDHRLVDGRESVTFLKSIKEKIEDPMRLVLGV